MSARSAAVPLALAPGAALAQAQAVTQGSGWPFEWIMFAFFFVAIWLVVFFVIAAVRWRANPPRPRKIIR